MGLLLPVALGVIAWAWFTGRLAGWSGRDALALAGIFIGARLVAGGGIVPGSILIGGGALWLWRNRAALTRTARRSDRTAEPAPEHDAVDDACRLLDVASWAQPDAINAAYRARIAAAHPDRGGSAPDAARLGAARDLLLARAAQRPR